MPTESKINILVVGSGGREHALVQKCLQSPISDLVIAAPGNGGMASEVQCFNILVEDIKGIVSLAQKYEVGLVVVGPEVPLSLGLVDALRKVGIPAYGPNQAAARLESSKAFCKDFFARHKIPTAAYSTFTEIEPALNYLKENPAPIVIKASGLAAGKGVIIAKTQAEAIAAVHDMLEGDAFGKSGKEIVIEETLYGEEVSIHVITSGENFVCLPPSQDHKRAGEGDTGFNTGGMGAYAPASRVTAEMQIEIEEKVIKPTLSGLKADGIDYRGTLYAGLMLTDKGVRILEYNVRFGDPETQVLLPMVADDLVPVLLASANGEDLPDNLQFHEGASIVVVLTAAGYPGNYEKGESIEIPDALHEKSTLVHAGTIRDENGILRTAGGRVLGVSGHAATLREAATLAYSVCDRIHFKGKYLRRDIGHRELNRT